MKIIQDFKCFPLNENENKNKNDIDFELTKYQQTKWKFYNENIYFIESSIHWNMLLFYIYNNKNTNNLEYFLEKKNNSYYTLIVDINNLNKELESIIFLFFYYDIHNRNKKVLFCDNNIYKWNNIYLDLKEKKVYSFMNEKIKNSIINQNI